MATTFDPQPVTLEGEHVRLEPLELRHAADLWEAAQDELIWRYLPYPPPRTLGEMETLIADAHARAERGRDVPFATILKRTGRAVGSTRYLDVDRANHNAEIGWTWLGTAVQRTPVNTECKYLLLRHLFEDHGALRVYLKTDSRNERSRNAILRIGAKLEGVHRQDRRLPDGYVRDSVYFSIIHSEWAEVKHALEAKLARRAA